MTCCTCWRRRDESQRDFGDQAEKAFRSDKNPDQIEAAFVFERSSPHADQRSIGQGNLKTENVIARHPVLQTAGSACVRGHISAEGTFFHARGIRRVEKIMSPGLGLKLRRDHARLDDANSIDDIDVEDAIHLRK